MRERLTMMNPDGKTYRIACAMDTEELHNIPGPGGYPSLLGRLVDQLGKLEEIKPIEKWLEEAKNKHMFLGETCAGELPLTKIFYIEIIPCGRKICKRNGENAVFKLTFFEALPGL